MEPLLFLIYVNDLADGLTSLCKTFADDTPLFSKPMNGKKPEIKLNEDLKLISRWTYQWKMLFNPAKQSGEVFFSHKLDNLSF